MLRFHGIFAEKSKFLHYDERRIILVRKWMIYDPSLVIISKQWFSQKIFLPVEFSSVGAIEFRTLIIICQHYMESWMGQQPRLQIFFRWSSWSVNYRIDQGVNDHYRSLIWRSFWSVLLVNVDSFGGVFDNAFIRAIDGSFLGQLVT